MGSSSSNLMDRLKSYLVTGLLAVLPLLLTLFILNWVAGIVSGYIGPRTTFGQMLQAIGYKFSPISNLSLAYVIGILLLIGAILALGVLLESRARKSMERVAQRTIFRLPLVSSIYRTTDKFVAMMPRGDAESMQGMQVVYCRFGQGIDTAGTLCLQPSPEVYMLSGRPHVIVIIPTAPIPIGGAMLFMPADQVFTTNLSADAFAGAYISMGVTTGPFAIGPAISERIDQAKAAGSVAPIAPPS